MLICFAVFICRIIRAFLVEEQNDCEEGLEDSKGEGKKSLKELKERLVK
jgi:hypothetical protein